MEIFMGDLIANLGGIFIYSPKPGELAAWYQKSLGINYEHTPGSPIWYATFKYPAKIHSEQQACCVLAIFQAEEGAHIESKPFRVNYRVHNLTAVTEHLTSLGIIFKPIETYPQGKFTWLTDPEGNSIELWEDTQLS
jgi:predicted enzyme related to lactoylglutathione lyase